MRPEKKKNCHNFLSGRTCLYAVFLVLSQELTVDQDILGKA
jgi:hypothetical protein